MPRYTTYNKRTSGRDLLAVRRPIVSPPVPDHLETLKKDELIALAEASGVDASGTKAEIAERLTPDTSDE